MTNSSLHAEMLRRLKEDRIITSDNHTKYELIRLDMYSVVAGMVYAWLKENYGYNLDCLVKMKLWMPYDKEPSIETSLLLANSSNNWDSDWENDWWEGQTRVEVIGIKPLHEIDIPENTHMIALDETILRVCDAGK